MPAANSSGFEIFASTAPGLESITAGELKSLGIRGRQEPGGVAFGGDLERIYRTNLWLRTASRVIVRLGRFHASTFFELERRAKKLPWEIFLPPTGDVRLRVTCRKSKLYHSDAVAERVLAAIAASALRQVGVRAESSDGDAVDDDLSADSAKRSSPSQLYVVRIVHDECEISADTSGELLHRRGYRQEIAKAPLRETIAAAMVLASGWKGESPLLDPMCGSGTIPIEAAMVARKIAPGARRRFQFMDWPGFDGQLWREIMSEADAVATEEHLEIAGFDRDAGAIQAATKNAERAGVAQVLKFGVEAVSGSIRAIEDPSRERGWILTNPPYGVRVGVAGDLRNLYATLGAPLAKKPEWRLGVLTSDSALVYNTGLKMRARFSTSNGGIPVAFFVSEGGGSEPPRGPLAGEPRGRKGAAPRRGKRRGQPKGRRHD
ncbi:MAG: THUMP domain-containing class I SAM-dependent RNA methyltransferase [Gemmatimonadaceae bacterium]